MLNQTVRRKDESEEAWQARQLKAIADINSHSLVLFHALVQVLIPHIMPHWDHLRNCSSSDCLHVCVNCVHALLDQVPDGMMRAGRVGR